MKYALFTGCVAKGAGRELLTATNIVAKALGITLVDMEDAACCGAGVLHEDNPRLGDALNARTFSLAEEQGFTDIVTICATCQGVMKAVKNRLDGDEKYRAEINAELKKDTGREYQGKVNVRHFHEVVEHDIGFEKMGGMVKKKLKGLKVAPYYGCYSLRPHDLIDHPVPDHPSNLERAIVALGAEYVHFPEMQKCCGFPILMPNKTNSLHLAGNVVNGAKREGAHCIVTVCPLCHLNLDSYQGEIEQMFAMDLGLPILHFQQLIALAMGHSPQELGLDTHLVDAEEVLAPVEG